MQRRERASLQPCKGEESLTPAMQRGREPHSSHENGKRASLQPCKGEESLTPAMQSEKIGEWIIVSRLYRPSSRSLSAGYTDRPRAVLVRAVYFYLVCPGCLRSTVIHRVIIYWSKFESLGAVSIFVFIFVSIRIKSTSLSLNIRTISSMSYYHIIQPPTLVYVLNKYLILYACVDNWSLL